MIGDNIKKIRKSKNITQKQLSEKTRISVSYIQQLEYGIKENPSLDTLNLIAHALNVSLHELTEGNVSEPPEKFSEITVSSRISDKEIKALLGQAITSISKKENYEVLEADLKPLINDLYKYAEFIVYKHTMESRKDSTCTK